jgi:hypothetical protein
VGTHEKVFVEMLIFLVFAGLALWLLAKKGLDLAAEYRYQLQAEMSSDVLRPRPVVTEESIDRLPGPVQRYMRMNGSVGKPRIASFQLKFDAQMFLKPGGSAMPGPAKQYDRFDPPKRMFFMQTRMYGLPVAVLHDYERTSARMRVRLASLFDVVNACGDELSKTETVTLLNDLCLYAPSWLADERLTWSAIDDQSAAVSFVNGPYTVSAKLLFNAAGELVNFVSNDRGAMQGDGTLRQLRWSTPIRKYCEYGGRRFASEGDAVWHYPEGEFVYGKFKLTDIQSE